jgi:hypothetical protein
VGEFEVGSFISLRASMTTENARTEVGSQNCGGSALLPWIICAILIVGIGRFQAIFPVFDAVPVAKILFFVGVLSVYFDSTRESRNKISSSPLARNLAWFFALSIRSVAFSVWKSQSLAFVIGPLFAIMGISWLIYVTGTSESIKKYCTALGLCGVLLSLTVIVTGSIGAEGRVQLNNGYDPNDLSFILDGVIPLMLSRLIRRSGAARVFWFGAIAISVWVIVLTESRGGILGLTAVSTYLAWTGLTPRTPQSVSSRNRASARERYDLSCLLHFRSW